MKVLNARQSVREFGDRAPQVLSNLLLAEAGINRPDGRRSAPSTSNRKEIDGAATGFISQNVYLFCASEGLATVVRASIDRPALAKAMRLRPDQHIVLEQPVGYPT